MDSLNKLKEQMSALLDKATDKEMIATLTQVNETINKVEADTTAIEKDNRELLNDYKEMVKHTSFKVEKEETRGASAPIVFEDFLKQSLAEIKNKNK